MPCISRFYGIVIYLYANDHEPPHFHARYAEDDAAIDIASLELLAGALPMRALKLVMEWSRLHQEELLDNWRRIQAGELPNSLEPLP